MTREEVRNLIPEIADDVLGKILDLNSRDIGKAKGNAEKNEDKIKELQQQIKEKDNVISKLEETTGDAEKIREELNKYKKAEEDRIAAEKAAEEDRILTEAVTSAIGNKEFVNEMTKNGYIAEVKKALADPTNKGKGAAEIFEAMTKDVEGIFKNPQQQKISIPGVGNTNSQVFTREQIKNMTAKEINDNWDSIKDNLKGL